jgi:hypothetical protein
MQAFSHRALKVAEGHTFSGEILLTIGTHPDEDLIIKVEADLDKYWRRGSKTI